ncbi:ATP-binding protein [Sulfurimonas sp. SAG-AH-194-C20]|nr:ATP-binding protein [Sulfurimonas sp. SAG-AH-194-C20]MDF1878169.1 ATP-binding protein [Sulfurimonas sp. SAG-AH-194-C20]
MKKIKISNIEKYSNLFNNNNNLFEDIKWVEPIFISMTSAYNSDVNFQLTTDNDYIYNMLTSDYKFCKTFSPISIVKTRAGLETISTQLTDVMLKNFKDLTDTDNKDLKHYLHYLFLELMNNVADHAQSDGHVMAQYYPTNKKIQFAISDRGVGFLSNLKLKFNDITTEEEAIHKALKKGITATPQKMYGQEKNAGFGLYAMVEILKQTDGRFIIISNDTLIRYTNGLYTTKKLSDPWKGVVVAFEFDEAKIEFDMDYFKRNYLWKEIIDDKDEDFY